MINSRDLNELLPEVQELVERFISTCKDNNIDLLVTSTYRDLESQAALFAQGRTTTGKIITNAEAGSSYHNYRCAIDVVPLVGGKAIWDSTNPIWVTTGRLGKECGLDWAGDWHLFKEYAHFQYTNGLTIVDFQDGARIT